MASGQLLLEAAREVCCLDHRARRRNPHLSPSLEVLVNWLRRNSWMFPWKNNTQLATVPSGKHTKKYGRSPCLMGKLTISMAIFNSFLYVYQRVSIWRVERTYKKTIGIWIHQEFKVHQNTENMHKFGWMDPPHSSVKTCENSWLLIPTWTTNPPRVGMIGSCWPERPMFPSRAISCGSISIFLKATFPYSENLRIPCFHRTPDLGFGMLLW